MNTETIIGIVWIVAFAILVGIMGLLISRNVMGLYVAFFQYRPRMASVEKRKLEAAMGWEWDEWISLLSLLVRFLQMSSFAFVTELAPSTRWGGFFDLYDGLRSTVHGFQGLYPSEKTASAITLGLALFATLIFFVGGLFYNCLSCCKFMRKPVLLYNWLLSTTLLMPIVQVLLRTGTCHEDSAAFWTENCWNASHIVVFTISCTVLCCLIPLAALIGPLTQLIPELNSGPVRTHPLYVLLLILSDVLLTILVTYFSPYSSLVELVSAAGLTSIQFVTGWIQTPTLFVSLVVMRHVAFLLQLWSYLWALVGVLWDGGSPIPFAFLLAGWILGIIFLLLFALGVRKPLLVIVPLRVQQHQSTNLQNETLATPPLPPPATRPSKSFPEEDPDVLHAISMVEPSEHLRHSSTTSLPGDAEPPEVFRAITAANPHEPQVLRAISAARPRPPRKPSVQAPRVLRAMSESSFGGDEDNESYAGGD